MWLQTGVWVPTSSHGATLAPATDFVATPMMDATSPANPGALSGTLSIHEV